MSIYKDAFLSLLNDLKEYADSYAFVFEEDYFDIIDENINHSVNMHLDGAPQAKDFLYLLKNNKNPFEILTEEEIFNAIKYFLIYLLDQDYLSDIDNISLKDESLINDVFDNYFGVWKNNFTFFEAKKQKTEQKGNKKMTKKYDTMDSTFWDRTKSAALDEGKELMIRQAAKQFRRTAAVPLIQGLKKMGIDNPVILGLLQSEQGSAVIGAILSLLTPSLPLPALGKDFANAIGRELRISGGDAVVDPVIEMVMSPLREIFTEQIKMLMPAQSDLQLTEGQKEVQKASKSVTKKRVTKTRKAKKAENIEIKVKEVKKSSTLSEPT